MQKFSMLGCLLSCKTPLLLEGNLKQSSIPSPTCFVQTASLATFLCYNFCVVIPKSVILIMKAQILPILYFSPQYLQFITLRIILNNNFPII